MVDIELIQSQAKAVLCEFHYGNGWISRFSRSYAIRIFVIPAANLCHAFNARTLLLTRLTPYSHPRAQPYPFGHASLLLTPATVIVFTSSPIV